MLSESKSGRPGCSFLVKKVRKGTHDGAVSVAVMAVLCPLRDARRRQVRAQLVSAPFVTAGQFKRCSPTGILCTSSMDASRWDSHWAVRWLVWAESVIGGSRASSPASLPLSLTLSLPLSLPLHLSLSPFFFLSFFPFPSSTGSPANVTDLSTKFL